MGNWYFIKISSQLNNGWPFTVGNKIIISSECLSQSETSLRYTLSHERIHTLQWTYPKLFDKVINQLGFINGKVNIDKEIVNFLNPDGLQLESSYIFRYHHKYYLPLMILENDDIIKKSFQVKRDGDNFSLIKPYKYKNTEDILGKKFNDCDIHQSYHPNEILADTGAHYILGNHHIKNKIILQFFKELSNLIFFVS